MKFVFFQKSRLVFKIFYCFCIFVNKHFINTGVFIFKTKRCHNAKPSTYYFYMRINILLNFRIYFSVPLMNTMITLVNCKYSFLLDNPRKFCHINISLFRHEIKQAGSLIANINL